MGKKLIIRGADWMMNAINCITIGKLFDSLTGLNKSNLAFTYVYKKVLPAGKLYFYYQSESSGTATFNFKLFTKNGDTFTQVSSVERTVKKNTLVDLEFTAMEGQYFGIYGGDRDISYNQVPDPDIPHFAATSGNVTSVDATSDFVTHFSFVVAIRTDA